MARDELARDDTSALHTIHARVADGEVVKRFFLQDPARERASVALQQLRGALQVFARRDDWDRLRGPDLALLVGIGSLWAMRAGLAAADLGGRDLGVGTVIAETAPHAIPELALIAVPAAFARKGARPSLLLLAGIATGLLVCAVIEGYL